MGGDVNKDGQNNRIFACKSARMSHSFKLIGLAGFLCLWDQRNSSVGKKKQIKPLCFPFKGSYGLLSTRGE